ncbi:aminoglycoside phosphotransferase family protein [Planomonospora parontospora]|uniref:aminoglycoside phosphotransferase family protein n=1 Tax=Planomonospora parontospora TaxID=58119 RepID=UPI0016712156|nr:aminoglycoside phosphotransferase family protein [Planomonospora parontospora]GGL35358.1 aminoglycoside O-phosphotransferase [Planomonospora parontospora subsp. antibiotica]GII17490.1 aminoglycoside O-phosphotransferase [Planomonospora parontospora subsp. antibiotica]
MSNAVPDTAPNRPLDAVPGTGPSTGPDAEARLVTRFGSEVRGWLAALPELVGRLAVRWDLEVTEAVPHGSTSRTFRVRRADGSAAFLKLTPEPEICAAEALALRVWTSSPHVVRLIDADERAGALLLEAVEPGTRVNELAVPPSPEQVSALLRSLRVKEAPTELPPLRERVEFLFELTRRRLRSGPTTGGIDAAETGGLLRTAERLLDRSLPAALALTDGGPAGLVHGDLHPGNVLDGGARGLVAIDPRPSVGDPAFDAVDWVLGGGAAHAEETAARLDLEDADRVTAWCRALAAVVAVPRLARGRHDDETARLLELAGQV